MNSHELPRGKTKEEIFAQLPPEREPVKRNEQCSFCRKTSVQPLIKMRINAIDHKFCPKCHEYVCANLVNKGGQQK